MVVGNKVRDVRRESSISRDERGTVIEGENEQDSLESESNDMKSACAHINA